MATYKTPGVFIEEISTLGSSIAAVETAIAGFVGYTAQAIYPDGTPVPLFTPVRITSLLEFQQIFGGPDEQMFSVSLTGTVPTPTTIAVSPTTGLTDFNLFYHMQMFYANGGGVCWVVSAGGYSAIAVGDLTMGIGKFEQIDEVTLLVVPESVFLSSNDRKTVNNLMAAQCAKLQDRFAVLDTVHVGNNTIFQDATNFRDNEIGPDNLKYAATYYPALNTPIGYFYKPENVVINDDRTQGASPYNYDYDTFPNNSLTTILNGTVAFKDFVITGIGALTGLTAEITLNVGTIVLIDPGSFTPPAPLPIPGAIAIVDFINNHPVLSQAVIATVTTVGIIPSFRISAKQVGTIGNTYTFVAGSRYTASGTNLEGGVGADKTLYNQIVAELAKYKLKLYPSAAMAGTYARVDADRGVWKAPANVGLALVNNPSITITDEDQANLNVDSVSGKSINAIRQFAGRGTLVWGARTLAGNDNEWRYINVRRLFNMVEESSKKATEFVVFESNDANTWQRVKGMIEAFLTGLWRDGALVGATTQQAFFVRVGLGTTMTPQDILEGRMIVQIGLAASRPAEFIILQFSHKLQE